MEGVEQGVASFTHARAKMEQERWLETGQEAAAIPQARDDGGRDSGSDHRGKDNQRERI